MQDSLLTISDIYINKEGLLMHIRYKKYPYWVDLEIVAIVDRNMLNISAAESTAKTQGRHLSPDKMWFRSKDAIFYTLIN